MSDINEQEKVTTEIVDDPREVRLAKREALISAGEEPYGRNFDVTAHAADLEKKYADLEDGASTQDSYRLAGRVMAVRDQGKVAFLVIRDQSGDIQLFCRINGVGQETYDRIKDLDVGDFIGAEGTIMRTRRGQLSLAPESVKLLSKNIRPLPEKFHGLSDKETRYRQRYVDLAMNREVRDVFINRFKITSAIRRYMEGEDFLEVETPMLHEIQGGASAKPFVTHHNALDIDFFMRIAPELHLKRLLVGGFERVFEINRCFRNEGMDQTHNPEFTTIEAYQAYTDIEGMKHLTQGCVQAALRAVSESTTVTYQGQEIELGGDWESRPMAEMVSEKLGQTVNMDTDPDELRAICASKGVHVEDTYGVGRMISELFDELVEETIVNPTFVVDHPVEISPLAKKKQDDPRLTDRFELFIAGHEYANAFSELNDPVDQKERFIAQVEAKDAGDDEAMGYDADYIRALEYGMPPAGGLGIGVDRLVMLLTDQSSIRDVLLFPSMRPEANL